MDSIKCPKCGYQPVFDEFTFVADMLNQTLLETVTDFIVNGCFALDTGVLHFSSN